MDSIHHEALNMHYNLVSFIIMVRWSKNWPFSIQARKCRFLCVVKRFFNTIRPLKLPNNTDSWCNSATFFFFFFRSVVLCLLFKSSSYCLLMASLVRINADQPEKCWAVEEEKIHIRTIKDEFKWQQVAIKKVFFEMLHRISFSWLFASLSTLVYLLSFIIYI